MRWFSFGPRRPNLSLRPLELSDFPRISLRTVSRGGPLADIPQPNPENLLHEADELMILIHGYATDEEGAFNRYKLFLANVGDPWQLMAIGLFWPGDSWEQDPDAGTGWLYPVSRSTTYSWQPPRAAAGGEKLAVAIADAVRRRQEDAAARCKEPEAQNLSIVAHSIGCRFALEFLAKLNSLLYQDKQRKLEQVKVRLVVLMAAAIPIYLIEDGERLGDALRSSEATRIFWSPYDSALGLAFRIGQWFDSDRPRWFSSRRALGRFGMADSDNIVARETALEHGEYWSNRTIASQIGSDFEDLYGTGPQARSIAGRVVGWRLIAEANVAARRLGS